MIIMKRYVEEDTWHVTTKEECLRHTEESGYWKEGHVVSTPFASYKTDEERIS